MTPLRAFLLFLFLGGFITLVWWLPGQFPGPEPALPNIETAPPRIITDLEIPIHSPKGTSTLKAAFAVPLGEHELRVYGGFRYTTPTQRIEGSEAIIDLRTGNARQIKNVRIWEK
jgi:hypothetical protein